ncbi:hypothetical protein ACIQXD_29835 [Streptomyces uncialis]|uniref:hypothetical protein n=1 Tax=Streptomyces uncialis TaxID=1048205 RepID=UPI0037F548B9
MPSPMRFARTAAVTAAAVAALVAAPSTALAAEPRPPVTFGDSSEWPAGPVSHPDIEGPGPIKANDTHI